MQMSPILARKEKDLSLLEGFCNENSPVLEKGESLVLEWLFVLLLMFHVFLSSQEHRYLTDD